MDSTAEELAAALAEAREADGGEPAEPATPIAAAPVPASTNAEIAAAAAAAAAKAVADHFGATRVEGTPTPAQRRKTTKEIIAGMSPEQRAELENRLLTGGAAAQAELYEMIARDELAGFEERAQPMVGATGSLLVDSFKARMYQEDRYAKQIVPIFDRAMASVNKAALVNLSEAERYRQLKTMWESSASEMFRAAASTAPPPARPPVMGGQRGGASSGPATSGGKPKTKIFEQNDDLQRLVETLKNRKNPDGSPMLTDEDLVYAEDTYADSIY
jgi:hypothetical protein